MDHEMNVAQLHQELDQPSHANKANDLTGAPLDTSANFVPGVDNDTKAFSPTGSDGDKAPSEETGVVDEEGYHGVEPTEEERKTLRKIGDPLPKAAFLVAVVELCERFTYYGASGLFQNYIQRPLDGSQGRGALGMGHKGATGLSTFFQFWCYVTPILGAIIADQYLGKYNTILIFCFVYMAGLLILTFTSIPGALEHGAGLGGFVVAVIVIGLGTGGIKSNVAPLIADQYKRRRMVIGSDPKTGERVIIDPAITIQRIYMVFYFCINLGSLSLIATPYMERDVGFWSAFVLCTCVFFIGTLTLILGKRVYIVRPPQGSVVTDAFRVIFMMIKGRNMDAAKPTYQAGLGKEVSNFRWNDHFVEEVKRALIACQVFCFYPIYWVVYGQFSNNFVTQAGQMEGHGIPNDLMQNFDPIAIIVFLPLLDRFIYPAMRKAGISFPPINRIVAGFWVGSLAMVYAAVIQYYIYKSGPCYKAPLCDASIIGGVAQGNHIHIAAQTGAYALIGISEIFASVTGLEYAYTKAPPSMKSFVQSMYLLTNAFGSAISESFTPVLYDPAIQWLFVGLAIAAFITGCIIWVLFHHLNAMEEDMNALESDYDSVKYDKNGDQIA
ncbi:di/tri peptide transporter 2 [Amniculicola lignicola CBS 123094]|uniref:Di/tri peptide transporter 2 n=1 Tax=Amniculicola lignicola CBS 123094 TaxID=1392246 RepID=A0A6A5WHT2_9PLEO|nr:di/tri peptide transporter 2 [Amniculicola lignicola CBS 123094]